MDKAVRACIKPSGTLWISGTYHSIYKCGFALQVKKFHILNDIGWFKPNAFPKSKLPFFLTAESRNTYLGKKKTKKAKQIFNYELMKNGTWQGRFIKKTRTCKCAACGQWELKTLDKYVWAVWLYKFHKKFPIQKIRLKPLRNKIDTNNILYMLMNLERHGCPLH